MLIMIDIVQFAVDREHPWVKSLGFRAFLEAKQLRVHVGGNEDSYQKVLQQGHLDILMNPELTMKKDHLHWRASGLNQVLLALAQKRDVAIGFGLRPLLQVDDAQRAVLLGRMMQNVRLCRKYKVRMVLCSFAKDLFGLRSASDVQSFGRVLGMTGAEAQQALQFEKRKGGVRFL